MKILILTTDTPHHTFFVRGLKSNFENISIICEKKKIKFPFKTFHKFEKKRDQFEIKSWFKNKKLNLKSDKDVLFIENINKLNSKKVNLSDFKIILVFGTSIIKKELLNKIKNPILNFHGGNPERYRGLDSHLWAILDKGYNDLFVTLHKLNSKIDMGDILLRKKIKLSKNMKLYQLRKKNTEICLELATKTINNLLNNKKLIFKRQKKKGKYFSAMDTFKKDKCNSLFNEFTKKLK